MKNSSENRDILDAPAPASASSNGVVHEHLASKQVKVLTSCDLDAERRHDLHCSFNNRISHLCKMAALVIAVVTFGSTILGQESSRFVVLGLSLSVALLAIALLQDSSQHKR